MYELLPPCFYPDANYYLLVKLADYCQVKGVSEQEFDRLCLEAASHRSKSEDINNLLLELDTDASWEKIKTKKRDMQNETEFYGHKKASLSMTNIFA